MEEPSSQELYGLQLPPKDLHTLGQKAEGLVDKWLNSEEIEAMLPDHKDEVRTFIYTSLAVLAKNRFVIDDQTVSEIAIAIAPGLEHRRQQEVYTDKATGLSNSDAFIAARPRIDEDPDSDLIFIDLINLGEINNNVSYDHGTNTLIEAANCIKNEAAKLKIHERDLFRVGGDEFGVKVPKEHARYLMYNILHSFGEREYGNIRTGLRGAYGDTFEEVDEKMKELKAAGKLNGAQRVLGFVARRQPPLATHLENQ